MKSYKNLNKKIRVVLRALVSCAVAACFALGAAYAKRGPQLGPLYDKLLATRPPLSVDNELLIIDTGAPAGRVIEPQAAVSVIVTMAEFGSVTLILQAPLLGITRGASVNDDELRYLFDREFAVLESNVGTLFDGIRLGSIAPGEASRYVEETLELATEGKHRLMAAAMSNDKAAADDVGRASALLTQVQIPDDVSLEVISSQLPKSARQRYSHGRKAEPLFSFSPPDRDGVLRRITPVRIDGNVSAEHVVYNALKGRFADSWLDTTVPFMVMQKKPDSTGSGDRFFYLDDSGAILVEKPLDRLSAQTFRRLPISLFLDYTRTNRALYRILADTRELAPYSGVSPESYPAFVYDRMRTIEEIPPGDTVQKEMWRDERAAYFSSLTDFFYGNNNGGTEMALRENFENLSHDEKLNDREKLDKLRDNLLATYATAKNLYNELRDIRLKLEAALPGSFCILGNEDSEASALLANAILTGRAVQPLPMRTVLLRSLLVATFAVIVTCCMSGSLTLFLGLVLSFFTFLGFCISFIATANWIDPVIPLTCVLSGSFTSAIFSFVNKRLLGSTV
jgi:hypothetical protein